MANRYTVRVHPSDKHGCIGPHVGEFEVDADDIDIVKAGYRVRNIIVDDEENDA
jgi:hypothetical protein